MQSTENPSQSSSPLQLQIIGDIVIVNKENNQGHNEGCTSTNIQQPSQIIILRLNEVQKSSAEHGQELAATQKLLNQQNEQQGAPDSIHYTLSEANQSVRPSKLNIIQEKTSAERTRRRRDRKEESNLPKKRPPKTGAERMRVHRKRKKLLDQQSEQQQGPDSIHYTLSEANQSAGPSKLNIIQEKASAERTRRRRGRKQESKLPKKRPPKTAAERMRAYRRRKKLLKKQREQQTLVLIDSTLPDINQNKKKKTATEITIKCREEKRKNEMFHFWCAFRQAHSDVTGPSVSHIFPTKSTVTSASESHRKTKSKLNLKIKCGACGIVGHIRTNKACPLYQQQKEIEQLLNIDPEDLVSGTKHAKTISATRNLTVAEEPTVEGALTVILDSVINRLKAMTESSPFLKPVNKELVKNYYNIVKCPMDLETISKKVAAHKYHSRHQVLVDIEQILENCILYNGSSSSFTKQAEQLVKICKTMLDEYDEHLILLENKISLAQELAIQDNMEKFNIVEPDRISQTSSNDQNSTDDFYHIDVKRGIQTTEAITASVSRPKNPKTNKNEAEAILEEDSQVSIKNELELLNELEGSKRGLIIPAEIPVEGLNVYYHTKEETNLLWEDESLDVDPNYKR